MERYGVAPQTVVNAINALRAEGLVIGLTGSGWYVRERRPVMRLARTRLSRAERAAGRGTFTTDAHLGGWQARVEVDVRVESVGDEVAAALDVEPGGDVLVRDRVMYADGEAVQLATSYFPRDLTQDTAIEQENTGPGGVYARLEERGQALNHFEEHVRLGQASESEAAQLAVPVGASVFRIRRTAHTAERTIEINFMTVAGERYELYYQLTAE